MITKKCSICGTEFQTKNDKGTFCSSKCKSKSFRMNEKKKIKDYQKWEKANFVTELKNEIQNLKLIVNEKDITIFNWKKAYEENEKKLNSQLINLTIINNSLTFEKEQLHIENEELTKKNDMLRRKIHKIKNSAE